MTEREEQAVVVLNTLHDNPLLSDIHRQALEVGIMAIKALSSLEIPNKWIPVSKRLPEENGYYLTTTMYGDVYCDYWAEIGFDRQETIIAWQPLPEPYKEA